MTILGIETSCDDTGVALYDEKVGLITNLLFSQLETHAPYGGVVPELASRDHALKLCPLVESVLNQTHHTKTTLQAIAYTAGPGLIGALLVGASFAHAFGLALNIPVIPVHHLEAHIQAVFLEPTAPSYPFLALLISGGHTMLIEAKALGQYELLGDTLDDAAGEAFDKTAQLLGLPYPGGPAISTLATQGKPGKYHFPRPLCQKPGLQFSFSGLKTHVRQVIQSTEPLEPAKADIAKAFEESIAETLTIKCERALAQTRLNQLVVAGGVAANHTIRQSLQSMCEKHKVALYFPRSEFCTDNGAMVAYTGLQHLKAGATTPKEIFANARWALDDIIAY